MNQHENRTKHRISVRKLIGLGTCPNRREFFSLDLIKSDEKTNYRAELLKPQGSYLGKSNEPAEIENFINSHVKKEWYRTESQYEILLREEAAYHRRLASFLLVRKFKRKENKNGYIFLFRKGKLFKKAGNRQDSAIHGMSGT